MKKVQSKILLTLAIVTLLLTMASTPAQADFIPQSEPISPSWKTVIFHQISFKMPGKWSDYNPFMINKDKEITIGENLSDTDKESFVFAFIPNTTLDQIKNNWETSAQWQNMTINGLSAMKEVGTLQTTYAYQQAYIQEGANAYWFNGKKNASTPEDVQRSYFSKILSTIIKSQASAVPSHTTYTVEKGDTLWDIAGKLYGNNFKWPEIAKANSLVNPDLIHPGNVFVIPSSN